MNEPGLIQTLLDFVAQHHDGLGAVVLFFSSLIEYVFPPFPGDVITLFGTYLVVIGLWSFYFALALVTCGSLVGAALDYAIGIWLSKRLDKLPRDSEKKRFTLLTREKYELLTNRFRKHGVAYILLNRFLPGIRAFFLVAAGAARMPFGQVMLYACISALVFNSMVLFAGYSVGANWDNLVELFRSYTVVAWCLIGLVVIALVVVFLYKRYRKN